MKLTRREKIKDIIGKLFLTVLFVGSMSLFFLLYPLVSEPDYYKNLILTEVNSQTGLTFDYIESEPIFFPFPGIELIHVTVSKGEEELIHVQKLKVDIYYGLLIGRNIEIRSVYLNTGSLNIKRTKEEKFPLLEKFFENNKISSNKNLSDSNSAVIAKFSEVARRLPTGLVLKNITLNFDDELYNRKINFYIWDGGIELERSQHGLNISLYGKLDEEIIQFYLYSHFLNDQITYEDLRLEGSIQLDQFSGENLKDILVIFPGADFRRGRITAVAPFFKRTKNLVSIKFDRGNIKNVALKGSAPFGDAYISVLVSYDIETSKISFDDISAEWKGKIKISGYGYITFVEPPLIPNVVFQGRSEYIDADSTLNLIKLFLEPDLTKSVFTRDLPDTHYVDRMKINLDFNLKQANIRGIFADDLNLSLLYQNSSMKIRKLNLRLYGGNLISSGEFYWGNQPRFTLNGKSEGVSLGEILTHQFKTSPLTGTLETNFELVSLGTTEASLANNLKLKAQFSSKNGELLSYTNILKPISSIGSIISLKKVDFTRSTPYDEFYVDMFYSGRKFDFSNFSLKAAGLSGSGSGSIDLEKNINMKFTIALPGITGKVLKLPIIYKGTYGVNNPYIDPVWLGSVYAGYILLAGPAGATVGGIAGSALSDYVDRAVDNVTDTVKSGWKGVRNGFVNIFSKSENNEEPIKKNTKLNQK